MSAELKFSFVCVMVVLLIIAIILGAVCRRLVEIRDRLSKLYVPVPVQQPSPAETAELIRGLKSVSEGLYILRDKIDERGVEKVAEDNPDSPDEEELSEDEKNNEKRFTEGVYNILNYDSRKGMES